MKFSFIEDMITREKAMTDTERKEAKRISDERSERAIKQYKEDMIELHEMERLYIEDREEWGRRKTEQEKKQYEFEKRAGLRGNFPVGECHEFNPMCDHRGVYLGDGVYISDEECWF